VEDAHGTLHLEQLRCPVKGRGPRSKDVLRLVPKRLAVERGVSLSALFQELIADYLVRVSTLTGRDWRADPFFQVGRRPGRSGHSRVAEEHDRHLYRERR